MIYDFCFCFVFVLHKKKLFDMPNDKLLWYKYTNTLTLTLTLTPKIQKLYSNYDTTNSEFFINNSDV